MLWQSEVVRGIGMVKIGAELFRFGNVKNGNATVERDIVELMRFIVKIGIG